MEINKAIDRIRNLVKEKGSLLDETAIYTIRKELKEAQPQADNSAMVPFLIVECFADNGEHSHWKLIERETGCSLWEQHQ